MEFDQSTVESKNDNLMYLLAAHFSCGRFPSVQCDEKRATIRINKSTRITWLHDLRFEKNVVNRMAREGKSRLKTFLLILEDSNKLEETTAARILFNSTGNGNRITFDATE